MVRAFGRLNAPAATQGFRVILPDGTELEQSFSLNEQNVSAGAVLTLEAAGVGATDQRYDDLVEAIGVSVSHGRNAWRAENSIQLSAYSASGLFAVAALLLFLGGDRGWITVAVSLVGAVLIGLASWVLVRAGVTGGATALALTVPVMTATAGFTLGGLVGAPLFGAGLGLAIGAAAGSILPQRVRSVVVAPVIFAVAGVVAAALITLLGLTPQAAASIVVAAATIMVFAAPWIGFAQMPARIEALQLDSTQALDGTEVARQVGNADVMVLAIRVSAGVLTILSAPLVAVDIPGSALMGCVGLASMLGTRSLYSKAEVLVSMITGLVTVMAAGVTASMLNPELSWWLTLTVCGVGAFVLAWNVITPQWRPWLNRAANGVQIVALMAVLPLTLLILGLV